MTVSMEARSSLNLFKMLQLMQLMDKSEEFDIFYIWMKEVEVYAEKYKS